MNTQQNIDQIFNTIFSLIENTKNMLVMIDRKSERIHDLIESVQLDEKVIMS